MNRLLRAIIAIFFIVIIAVSAINICRDIGRSARVDITDEQLYTLSDGTKAILGRLNQPLKLKLYYARTAAMKGPDQIQFFNTYFFFVNELLQEYAAQAKGMIEYELVDPRPFSDEEEQAIQYGLQRFPITEDESFFFGLALQTEFGTVKTIPFFAPERQRFIEYDISYLIDTAVTREKRRVGILSSLPVMGDDASGYMAQMMRMQGQEPKPAWAFVTQLKQQYEVTAIDKEAEEITDIDTLLVVHPKELPEKTLFAIDQFVLNGGRTIVCVDPHCFADQPDRSNPMAMQQPQSSASQLNTVLNAWGLEMPDQTFAGDRDLAVSTAIRQGDRPSKIIGFLDLNQQCMNRDSSTTAELASVKMLFSGVLRKTAAAQGDGPAAANEFTQLLQTTNRGNSWRTTSPYDLMMMNPDNLMKRFSAGTEPVAMAYMVTGSFVSAFPNGVVVPPDEDSSDTADDPCATAPEPRQLTGLTQADPEKDCAVVVIADVDFITDMLAYRQTFFGTTVVGDNSGLLLNTIEDLSGSTDLISIRSRGSFQRPFGVVEEIEAKADEQYKTEVAAINARIKQFEGELNEILSSSENKEQALLEASILGKRRELEKQIRTAKHELRQVNQRKRVSIERLGMRLRSFNMLTIPGWILIIAIIVGIRRGTKRRRYISHASDA